MQRFPAFSLERAGGGRLTRDGLLGSPWVVYLGRHTGCSVCQHHLRAVLAARPAIEALGAGLLVVFPNGTDEVDRWRAAADAGDVAVAADPDAAVYRALDVPRGRVTQVLGPATIAQGIAELARGRRPRRSGGDARRLGADVVLDDRGRISWIRRAEGPTDRAAPAVLLAELRRVAGPGRSAAA